MDGEATASLALWTHCLPARRSSPSTTLTPVQLREIVRHMAQEIGARLRSRNITLVMTDRALDAVVQIGAQPTPAILVVRQSVHLVHRLVLRLTLMNLLASVLSCQVLLCCCQRCCVWIRGDKPHQTPQPAQVSTGTRRNVTLCDAPSPCRGPM